MPNSPSGDSPDFHRVYALFERALALPSAEREAFVRREAGSDHARCVAVLELLAHGQVATADLTDRIAEQIAAAQNADANDNHDGGERRVRSTAAGEVLAQIHATPLLDDPRYRRGEQIGIGGMGEISFVHDRRLNRGLAIKALLSRRYAPPLDEKTRQLQEQDAAQRLARFLEEAQVTSQLEHPGVVPVHEVGRDANGKLCFTMRRIKGNTVSTIFRMAREGEDDWTRTRALEVALKICDTMAFAHAKGVLHRDLKPDNVMVGRFGEVYVMDWGLAKVRGQRDLHDLRIRQDAAPPISVVDALRGQDAESADDQALRTMDGTTLGTPNYMPPEQGRGEPLDERADVYAIGAMLYELLTGRAPYALPGVRQRAEHVLADLLDGPPRRIEDLEKGVAPELVAIVDKAMQRERERRYADTTALAAELRAFLDKRVVQAYRTGALVEMKLWVRRNRPLAASLLAAMLILVAGMVAVSVYAEIANQNASDNARLAQEEAGTRRRFEGKVQEFEQLKLVVTYERLIKDEPKLSPGWPYQLPAIDRWLEDAQRLLSLRDELEATVTSLLHEATDAAREGAESASVFLANSLAGLGDNLKHIDALLPDMQKRQRWAQVIGPLTLAHPNAKVSWADARAAIAKADGVDASTLYAGQNIALRDEDVWGLVPIGMNAASKLWEFYDLRSAWDGMQDPSGLPIPEYGSDGKLTINGETGIVFVLLPGGTLPPGTKDTGSDTSVRLDVPLDPFFLGKHEVTQGQWFRWTGKKPSVDQETDPPAPPVETVSWHDADPILRAQGLVMPSELQWEYGIRAGTTTRWWTGDDKDGYWANEYVGLGYYSIGSWSPNGFGLFDMGGNVGEWCFDNYSEYGTERTGDGRRPEHANGSVYRVVRGSVDVISIDQAQSGSRFPESPTYRHHALGLRAARTSRR